MATIPVGCRARTALQAGIAVVGTRNPAVRGLLGRNAGSNPRQNASRIPNTKAFHPCLQRHDACARSWSNTYRSAQPDIVDISRTQEPPSPPKRQKNDATAARSGRKRLHSSRGSLMPPRRRCAEPSRPGRPDRYRPMVLRHPRGPTHSWAVIHPHRYRLPASPLPPRRYHRPR